MQRFANGHFLSAVASSKAQRTAAARGGS